MPQNESSDNPIEQRATFQATGQVTETGKFEIYCITPGYGNGWKFSEEVLRKSLSLWDGVSSFIDHSWFGQSLRDLGGIIYAPSYDNGIRATLRAAGPSGPLMQALAAEMLSEAEPKPRIGFSADVVFTAKDKEVKDILRVYSVDVVFDPARGGAFLRALNSVAAASGQPTGGYTMAPLQQPAPVTPELPPNPAQEVTQMREDLQSIFSVKAEREKQLAEIQAAKVQLSAYLLDAGLSVANDLPAASVNQIRKQFTGKAFEAVELAAAIADQRKLIGELTGGAAVRGVSHAREMFDSGDQIEAAVCDLFEVDRDEKAKNLKVARLSGIRELYLGLTGDDDFRGGYYPTRVRFNTGNFTNLVANVMNKAVVTRWDALGREGYDWWKKIVTVEHFTDLKQVSWLITGTIASTPTVARGAEYTPAFLGDGKETSDFTKYGHYVGIDIEDLINDDTRKLRAVPRELASAGIRKVSSLVAAIFTAATYTGPTMADTGVLFNNTAVTTVGGHANLTASALGTDYTAWNALALLIYNQRLLVKDATGYAGTGEKQALKPSICLVNSTLGPAADALFVPRWASNPYQGGAAEPLLGAHTWGGKVDPVIVPEVASTTWWAGVVNPLLVPGVMIGEVFGLKPEVFVAGDEQSPAVFMNDEIRIKSRHFLAVGVGDFRPLARGNA